VEKNDEMEIPLYCSTQGDDCVLFETNDILSPNQLMQTSFVSSPPNITAAGEGLSVAVANSVSVPVPTPGWEG
jgi:hypothetical protein